MKSHNASTFFIDMGIAAKPPKFRGKRAVLSLGLAPTMNRFQEMVRARLRSKTPNFSTLATYIKSDPSTIQKRLKDGGTALCLDWLDSVTAFYQMSVSEMCALPGSLWQEVKPLEAQLLAHFRAMTELQRHSLLSVLDRSGSQPLTRRKGRLGRAELTEEQQLVVDLYARSNEQARSGILKTLRGTARVGDVERDQTIE